MRAKISISNPSGGTIPYDYQYALASMLYHRLAEGNVELANEIHSHQNFKFYTFSNLVLQGKKDNRNGLAFKDAYFNITSPDIVFIRSFAEGLLNKPRFRLGRANLIIKEIRILPNISIGEECTFKTLSPIYIKTKRKVDDKLQEWDLYPKDGKFHENAHKNLVERYEEFYDTELDEDYFEITDVSDFKGRRIKIAGSYRRCSLMTFKVNGAPALLNFAYDAGFGEKNAMGFGCLEVVDNFVQKI